MKKLIPLILLLSLLTSCGSEVSPASDTSSDTSSEVTTKVSETTEATPDTTAQTVKAEPYTVELDCGVSIAIGSDADKALKAITDKLGDALDYMEAPSCVHEGSDKVYTFDGFTVSSSPDADSNEYIAELTFISDAVGFSNGIMIGSTDADIEAAFGSEFEENFGVRKYTLDGAVLTFTLTDGAATAISVSAVA